MIGWLRDSAAAAGLDGNAYFAGLSWRVNRPGPCWGIWGDYPILSDGAGASPVWDELDDRWRAGPPTYGEVVALGFRPMVVVDVAVQHKGSIAFAIEIRERHAIEPAKLGFLQKVTSGILDIPSHWVLGQIDRPMHIPEEFWVS